MVVDDLANSSAVGTDDLICDFLNCEVVDPEDDVEESGCSGTVGTNFSVGYLIGGSGDGSGGGGGGGENGGGMVESDGTRDTGELHVLPTSDCLSLVPIVTTAFEEASAAEIVSSTGHSTGGGGRDTYASFWTSTSSNESTGECTSAVDNGRSGGIIDNSDDYGEHGFAHNGADL